MIYIQSLMIWPCSLSHPNNYRSPLAHLVQMTLALCCLNKLKLSTKIQDPWPCYPSASCKIIHKAKSLPHLVSVHTDSC